MRTRLRLFGGVFLRTAAGMGLVICGLVQVWSVHPQTTMLVLTTSHVDTTQLMMGKVGQQIEIHGMRKGYPVDDDGLAELFPDGMPTDAWNRPLLYLPHGPDGRPFELISLGEDGRIGGSGNDADLYYSEDGR